jgi:hypothetical protein
MLPYSSGKKCVIFVTLQELTHQSPFSKLTANPNMSQVKNTWSYASIHMPYLNLNAELCVTFKMGDILQLY